MPVPMYYQIRTSLMEAIEAGKFRPGDRIPSERELTDQFSVSRMTARQAVTELENLGYLYRVQGKGTFVSAPKLDQPLVGLTSFSEDMRRRGLKPGARVLEAAELPATPRVARALSVGDGEPVYRVERLRLADDQPMALETVYLPVRLCPGLIALDLEASSLYALLEEHYGVRPRRATQRLEAVAADHLEARMLNVHEGTPLLGLERISRDGSDLPVEYTRSIYRGDRYRFITELIGQEVPAHAR